MKVKEILNITKGQLIIGNENLECENFSKDTRTIQKGDIYIRKKRKFTGQFKVDVVEYMYEHRYSYKKTSMKFTVALSQVKEWDLVYRYEGKDVLLKGNYVSNYMKRKNKDLEKKSKEELMEEIEQLRMENAYLKKLRALVQKGTKPNNGKK